MAVVVQRSLQVVDTGIVLAATVLILALLLCVWTVRHAEETHERAEATVHFIPITSGATGPETLAFDPHGEGPYTGVSDGRILKWKHNQWLDYAVDSPPSLSNECRGSQEPEREDACGRPLGLQFHRKTGDLYIADAYFGLLVVGVGDVFAKPVATQAEGHPFVFTNSLDIDQNNGILYFTDSSMRFQRRDYMEAITTKDNTGRLMKYDLHAKEVQVLLGGLYFPNGVLLSQDGSFLLVAETSTCRILRYWLRPPKAGLVEVLAQLPGAPDNIKRSPRGGFWVAMNAERSPERRILSLPPWLRKAILSRWTQRAMAMRMSEDGEILEAMEGFGSKFVRFISEVEERNGTLWIGSVVNPYVAVYSLYNNHGSHYQYRYRNLLNLFSFGDIKQKKLRQFVQTCP